METCKQLLSLLEKCCDSEDSKEDIQKISELLNEKYSDKVKET